MASRDVFTLTGTTPDSASTAIVGSVVRGLRVYDRFSVHASLVGASGGALDVYLQRKIDTNVWSDWVHFAQLASGASAIEHALDPDPSSTTIADVAGGTDSTPTVALAADTAVGGHPGDEVRMVAVAGAGTTTGATITVYLVGIRGIK